MLGRGIGLILANTALGGVLGVAALKAFAVGTGPHADILLGQLAFAIGLAGMLRIVLELGPGSAHVRRVSEGGDLGVATASYAAAELCLVTAYLSLVVATVWIAADVGKPRNTFAPAVLLVALYFAFLELRTIFTATFEGRQEYAKSQLTVLTENVVRVVLMILFAAAFAGGVLGKGPHAGWMRGLGDGLVELLRARGAELLAAAYAVAGAVSFFAGWLQFRRGYPLGRPDPAVIRDYWSFGRQVFVMAAAGTLSASLDKVVIAAFWEPANTGRYFGAQRISDLIVMVPLAVYTVLLPALSGSYGLGDRAGARAALESAARHVSMAIVPVVAFTIALASPLLSLVLTGVFVPAVGALRLLAVHALVYALSYMYVTLLHALGRPDLTARSAVVGLLVNAGFTLLLVPPDGTLGLPLPGLAELGAAIAALSAAAAQLALLRREAHRLEHPLLLRRTVRHVAAGAVMAAALWPFAPRPEAAHWYLLLGLAALGWVIYLAALAMLREFTGNDFRLYVRALNPFAMARYVAGEIKAPGPVEPRP